MAKFNPVDDGTTEHQRFVEAAREDGTDESQDAFRRVLRKVATAPVKEPAPKNKE